jgi:hypothetical protein
MLPLAAVGCWLGPAGSPARRRGNFLLRGQKKVTKEEALNRTPATHARAAPCKSRSVCGTKRPAALSLLSLSPKPFVAAAGRLTRGCTPGSREIQRQRRSGDAIAATTSLASPQRRGIPGEPGVQPALTGVKERSVVLVTGTAARAQRLASARNAAGPFRAPFLAASLSCAVQRLSFGDFSLAQQRKVTRPPGRTPGMGLAINQQHRAS